ncbi:ATP-binding protein [Streptomyces sp. MST-110588]|uniref:ATP-binding protein n=1 Tax=Streptomyces sp. MST-110588 TaxID=2833628 RepID=UPI001F5D03DE|nr:ATP-binding protein [Streptomyces sp. MST-110588]UNO41223.1 ATP-binding protein [Streptomyces sp. MST-110588]
MSGDWEYALEIPDNSLAPRVARRVLRLILEEHGEEQLTDTAELLASELVTNAHRHAKGGASVRVKRVGERLRVSVWDGNPELPVFDGAPTPAPEAEAGRGLGLVRLCADSYGGFSLGAGAFGVGGKLIWFELGRGGGAGGSPIFVP